MSAPTSGDRAEVDRDARLAEIRAAHAAQSWEYVRDLLAEVDRLRAELAAARRPAPFRRGVDELTDTELDEARAAASADVYGPGDFGVSRSPEARGEARRLYDLLSARLRLDGPEAGETR